jgi:thermostable 8-oxoguanine DNA glycosylase
MCTYGGRNSKTVTDVFWKEGAKVPDILVSEVIALIEKGIISANNDDTRNMIFESTLRVYNVPKSTTIDDLKKQLANFKNEMYVERGKQGELLLHFYKKMRAKDAHTFLVNSPN